MESILRKINDLRLNDIIDCLDNISNGKELSDRFEVIVKEYPKYDRTFLWLLCYPHEYSPVVKKYIDANYKKFHQYLDSDFPGKLAEKGKFESRMWEMLLLDMMSSSGKLIQKGTSGADILFENTNGQIVQVEAIVADEAKDESLRSIRPDYSNGNMFVHSGNIEDTEWPILYRFASVLSEKSRTHTYDKSKPLIVAINTAKVVGLSSRDNYILKRILFGLGSETITLKSDGSFSYGLEQRSDLSKKEEGFPVGWFRAKEYQHISGIIYTSQSPIGLVPGGWGWSNYGITYIPNPQATHKVDLDFNFFRQIICNEEIYQEIEARQEFVSTLT